MLKFFRKWFKRDDGTTAIEFSFLIFPYILLTLGIVELSLMFTAESLLEGSTSMAARQVKTGQIQSSGSADMQGDFRAALCAAAPVLITCDDIVIEAMTMDSFSGFGDMAPVFDEDGNMVSQGFALGGSSERVLIRVSYRYTGMTPLVGPMLWGADNSRLFMSTIVLQTEPYDFAAELMANGEI